MRYSPLPYEVPEFERALASGLIRLIPTTPPEVTVRPTSAHALRTAFLTMLAVFVGGAVVITAASRTPDHGGIWVVAVLGTGAGGFFATARAWKGWGRALLPELALGYTTTTPGLRSGAWWIGGPAGPAGRAGADWDWSGLWLLQADGTVRSAPSRQGVPPGVYPSPRRPGAMELWTGRQWTAYFPADHPEMRR